MKNKLILIDIDGVCLDWMGAVTRYIETHHGKINKNLPELYHLEDVFDMSKAEADELIEFFNKSDYIENLETFEHAVESIKELHDDHGFVFHALSSFGSCPEAGKKRIRNIENVIHSDAFVGYTFIDHGPKDNELAKFKDGGHFWIEDVGVNALAGLNQGLKPILIERVWNKGFSHPEIPKYDNWIDIKNHIIVNSVE